MDGSENCSGRSESSEIGKSTVRYRDWPDGLRNGKLSAPMGESNIAIPIGAPAPTTDALTVPAPSAASSSRAWELLKWVFSFPVMLGVALVGRVFYEARAFFVDPDLWWHIKTGQDIVATHHWPTTDPYSFTVHGQPWIAYEWLGDVVAASVSKIGGVRALDFYLIALGGAILIGLYCLGTLRSGNSKAGFVAAGLLSSLAFASFNLRPQMLGYLLLVLLLIALERFRQGKTRSLWLLPLVFLVWINSHGSWVIGLGTLFVYWISGLFEFCIGGIEAKKWSPKERRQISLVLLLCLAVLPLTPYGTRLAAVPFRIGSTIPVSTANVMEWFPMPFNQGGGKLFLVLLLGFFVVQIACRLSWRIEELALWLFGAALACIHLRFILIFVPFFTPLLATVVARWLPPYSRAKEHYVLNGVLIGSMLTAMVYFFPSRALLEERVADRFPVKAVAYMQQHPVPGPMLDSYGFGGYLVWTGRKVFIDGRSELYEYGGVLSDYLHMTQLKPGALRVLRNYGIRSCLLDAEQPLATVLSALPNWHKVYADSRSVIFVRRDDPKTSAALANVIRREEQR
jgi:hypothetical protein